MGTAIMSMLASLIALTHAQLEAMKQLQNSMPTLAPVHSPLSLPTLSNLQSLHSMPNFLSNQQSNNEIGQEEKERIPCTCGVFLSGQFKKGAPLKLSGGPALLQELNDPLTCNTLGEKQCINKCLETVSQSLKYCLNKLQLYIHFFLNIGRWFDIYPTAGL